MYQGHPKVKELETQLDEVAQKVHGELVNYMAKTRSESQNRSSTIAQLSQRLQTLPEKEMQLAELQRNQQVNSEIYSNVLSRLNQAKVADAVELAEVYVMDYAVPPLPPPVNRMQFLGISLLVGIGLAFAPVVLIDQLDKTARTGMDLQKLVDFPVLESVPSFSKAQVNAKQKRRKRKPAPFTGAAQSEAQSANTNQHAQPGRGGHQGQSGHSGHSPYASPENRSFGDTIAESQVVPYKRPLPHPSLVVCDRSFSFGIEIMKSLRAKILLSLHQEERKSVVITSLDMDAGKSTIAANLAILCAQQGMKTLLVDGDMRKGVLHDLFRLTRTPGLSDFLNLNRSITTITLKELIRPSMFKGLWVIPCGSDTRNAAELMSGRRIRELIDGIMGIFDMVILDTPPFGVAIDAVSVHDLFSRYVLIARAGGTNIFDLKRKLREFPMVEKKVMGIVLNQAGLDQKMAYYRNSRYYS